MADGEKGSNTIAVVSLSILVILSLTILMTYSRSQQLAWHKYSPELIQSAANKQPVLIKFTADWCTGCKTLETTVYQHPQFVTRAKQANILPVTADLSDFNQRNEDLLQQYGGEILPYVVLIDRNGDINNQLHGIFSHDQIIEIISSNNN